MLKDNENKLNSLSLIVQLQKIVEILMPILILKNKTRE